MSCFFISSAVVFSEQQRIYATTPVTIRHHRKSGNRETSALNCPLRIQNSALVRIMRKETDVNQLDPFRKETPVIIVGARCFSGVGHADP